MTPSIQGAAAPLVPRTAAPLAAGALVDPAAPLPLAAGVAAMPDGGGDCSEGDCPPLAVYDFRGRFAAPAPVADTPAAARLDLVG
ncbi:MAG: hypothetical protein FJ293_01510 [Planctomycetes bacterium]|nr:hypothetical protein [Planctomycetota bacterium]